MTDDSDDDTLARDIINVHGPMAAGVARDNARAAVVAGQGIQARSWIRVLAIIQRQQAGQRSTTRTSPDASAGDITAKK